MANSEKQPHDKGVVLSVWFPREIKSAATELAAAEDRSLSAWLVRLIRREIERGRDN